MSTFAIRVVSPEATVFEGEAEHLLARNLNGWFGIKARHAPFLTMLEAGELHIDRPDSQRETLSVTGGCLEFSQNKCTVLADAVASTNQQTG